jgi:hypothetical protein
VRPRRLSLFLWPVVLFIHNLKVRFFASGGRICRRFSI